MIVKYAHLPSNLRRLPFDRQKLITAIAIRDVTYKLLMWISEAIDQRKILPSHAIHHSGGIQAATDWLQSCYHDIPESLRPLEQELDQFAAFFSTYLTSTFDVVLRPGTRGEGRTNNCRCEICMRIINASHLQPKKLRARDKLRADDLMFSCLANLAREHGLDTNDETLRQLVSINPTRAYAGYVTYGHWLIRRLEGVSDGPAVLALWRLIAWKPEGGVKKNFVLDIEDFEIAESQLLSLMRQ